MVDFTNHFTCVRIGHHVYQENTAGQRRQLWAGCMNHTRRMRRHNNHNRDRNTGDMVRMQGLMDDVSQNLDLGSARQTPRMAVPARDLRRPDPERGLPTENSPLAVAYLVRVARNCIADLYQRIVRRIAGGPDHDRTAHLRRRVNTIFCSCKTALSPIHA